jgi:hypothetical protein
VAAYSSLCQSRLVLKDDMSQVRHIGIDETSVKKGQNYITVVHDLQAKRLLFATPGRDHQTVLDFAQDLKAHGGSPEQIEHVCMDMSGAFLKGAKQAMPEAAICYDRFHVAALAGQAMDEVRSAEFKADAKAVTAALGDLEPQTRRSLAWAMRTHPLSTTTCSLCWSTPQHRPLIPMCGDCRNGEPEARLAAAATGSADQHGRQPAAPGTRRVCRNGLYRPMRKPAWPMLGCRWLTCKLASNR